CNNYFVFLMAPDKNCPQNIKRKWEKQNQISISQKMMGFLAETTYNNSHIAKDPKLAATSFLKALERIPILIDNHERLMNYPAASRRGIKGMIFLNSPQGAGNKTH
ncbi:MAG: hypothetical protein ACK5HT_12170, partial [Draconibacterium sp.]